MLELVQIVYEKEINVKTKSINVSKPAHTSTYQFFEICVKNMPYLR